jgi:hypothetical protein
MWYQDAEGTTVRTDLRPVAVVFVRSLTVGKIPTDGESRHTYNAATLALRLMTNRKLGCL